MFGLLNEFREKLDSAMLKNIHDRIILYGYGYTGRFLRWYAKYYHNIEVDYIISLDMTRSQVYDMEIFRPSLLEFDFKDIKRCVIWLAEPLTDKLKEYMENNGFYVGGDTDFYNIEYL